MPKRLTDEYDFFSPEAAAERERWRAEILYTGSKTTPK